MVFYERKNEILGKFWYHIMQYCIAHTVVLSAAIVPYSHHETLEQRIARVFSPASASSTLHVPSYPASASHPTTAAHPAASALDLRTAPLFVYRSAFTHGATTPSAASRRKARLLEGARSRHRASTTHRRNHAGASITSLQDKSFYVSNKIIILRRIWQMVKKHKLYALFRVFLELTEFLLNHGPLFPKRKRARIP